MNRPYVPAVALHRHAIRRALSALGATLVIATVGCSGLHLPDGEELAALDAAYEEDKRFSLIEVGLQPGDISPILRGFVHAVKNRVHAS